MAQQLVTVCDSVQRQAQRKRHARVVACDTNAAFQGFTSSTLPVKPGCDARWASVAHDWDVGTVLRSRSQRRRLLDVHEKVQALSILAGPLRSHGERQLHPGIVVNSQHLCS